jgi:DNA-binding NtrC family response regulator
VSGLVVVFSADPVRGRIIQKVLMRSRVEALVLETIEQAREAISRQVPGVAIFDTAGCFKGEINHLENLCGTLPQTAVILVGDGVVLERFEASATEKELRLPNPLDPELIAAKVGALLSLKMEEKRPEEKRPGESSLENNLKGFLRLQ